MTFFSPIQSGIVPMEILGSDCQPGSPNFEPPYIFPHYAGGVPELLSSELKDEDQHRYVVLWLPAPDSLSPARSVTICWKYGSFPNEPVEPPKFQVVGYSCPARPTNGTGQFSSPWPVSANLSALKEGADLTGVPNPTFSRQLTVVKDVLGLADTSLDDDVLCFLRVSLPYPNDGAASISLRFKILGLAVDQW